MRPTLNRLVVSLTADNSFPIIHLLVGAWLSLVERSVRDREVGGSNPLAPTKTFSKVIGMDHLGGGLFYFVTWIVT